MSLRRTQFRTAEKNTAMAIWLGKQYLGQKEPEHVHQAQVPNDAILTALIDALKANNAPKQ